MTTSRLTEFFYNNNTDLTDKNITINTKNILGKGTSGVVYSCNIEKKKYAVKICRYNDNESTSKLELIKFIDSFKHPNIARHYAAYFDYKNTYVIMDYFPTDLHMKLHNHDIYIAWGTKFKYILGVGLAIQCLHLNNFIHCDIKSNNVLLDYNDNAKLCDLDFVISGDSNKKSNAGSRRYLPPEIFADHKNFNNNKTSDIFSFSKLAWVVAARREPYADLSHEDKALTLKLKENAGEKIPEDCLPGIANLITLGCFTDPKQRPSIDKCIEILENKKSEKKLC